MSRNVAWEKLESTIYYCDGSFRDIYIFNTNETDWEKFVTHVNNTYTINWHNIYTNKEDSKIDYSVVREILRGNSEFVSTAGIFIDNLQINAHFFY